MSWFRRLRSFKRSFSSSSDSSSSRSISVSSKSQAKLKHKMSSQNTAVQEPTVSKGTPGRETGFPEPLSADRNTTLPHPSADTSPNATIVAPDMPQRSHSRSRSFLRNRSHTHKASKSQEIPNGTITTLEVDPSKMYENIEYADGSKETTEGLSPTASRGVASPSGSVGAGGSVNGESGEEGKIIESDFERDETGYAPGQRKKGVLRKRTLHRV